MILLAFAIIVMSLVFYIYFQTIHQSRIIKRKAIKTMIVLNEIALKDKSFQPSELSEMAADIFIKLRQCRNARIMSTMKDLIAPELYEKLRQDTQKLIELHQINMFERIQIYDVRFINIHYTIDENKRRFTALVHGSYYSYFIHDISRTYIQGNDPSRVLHPYDLKAPYVALEYLTFRWENQRWKLMDIGWGKKVKYLKEANVVE